MVVAVVFAVAAFGVGDPTPANACKSKTSESAMAYAKCEGAATKAAAAVTVDAHECCKEAVSAALASYSAKIAACSKSASATTAGSYSCSRKSASAASADVAKSECCKKSVAAFDAAVAEYTTTVASAYSCSSKSADAKAAGTKTAGSYSCSKSASTASLAAITYDVGKKVELTGSVACGHCDLEYTEACQAVFKTASGKAYLIVESELVEKMRKESSDNGYKIVTRVRDQDGKKILEVEKISAL